MQAVVRLLRRRAGSLVTLAVVLLIESLIVSSPAFAHPGDLDLTFDTDGLVSTDFSTGFDYAYALAMRGTAITAGGAASVSGQLDFGLARYLTNGTLDTACDVDGKQTTDFGGFDYGYGLTLQGGKPVQAGFTGAGTGDFALARYNVNCSLDTTFDTDGKVTTDFFGGLDQAYAVITYPPAAGRLVAAGSDVQNAQSDFALARYRPNGALDTTFDTDGKVTTDISGGNDQAYAVVRDSSNRIVAAGWASVGGQQDFAVARYLPNGSLDTAGFGAPNGWVTTDFGTLGNDVGRSVVIMPNGDILVAGSAVVGGQLDFALAEYTSTGALDTTFCGGTGLVTTDFFGGNDTAYAVLLEPSGLVVAVGAVVSSGQLDFGLSRYDNGCLDTSFGVSGKVNTDFGTLGFDQAYAGALDSKSRIVAAGPVVISGSLDFGVARYKGTP